jgi:uncharacterized membrane protein YdjX (TVP38/TMEM64 family)
MSGLRRQRFGAAPTLLWRLGGVLLAGSLGWLCWQLGPWLWTIVQDEAALEEFVAALGLWGPLMLVGLNAVQIVVAPLPGYVMQIAAGYLYGPFWGGILGALGLLVGAVLAMGVARSLGKPVVERLVGRGRLAQWGDVSFSNSTLLWFLILLAPTGDLPYFLAGLAQVSFTKILLLTLAIRVPTTMLVAAVGAGVWLLPGWQLAALLALLGLASLGVIRYQDKLQAFVDRRLQRRLSGEEP